MGGERRRWEGRGGDGREGEEMRGEGRRGEGREGEGRRGEGRKRGGEGGANLTVFIKNNYYFISYNYTIPVLSSTVYRTVEISALKTGSVSVFHLSKTSNGDIGCPPPSSLCREQHPKNNTLHGSICQL